MMVSVGFDDRLPRWQLTDTAQGPSCLGTKSQEGCGAGLHTVKISSNI